MAMTLRRRANKAMVSGAVLCAVGVVRAVMPGESYTLLEIGGAMIATGLVMYGIARSRPDSVPAPNHDLESDLQSTRSLPRED